MRDIKFRAWALGRNNTMQLIYSRDEANLSQYFSWTDDFEQQQYTGLKDKNGVEVYEGDIVRCDSRRRCPHEIYWRIAEPFSDIGGWGLKGTSKDYDWVGGEEVIGNMHENPELLNG